jgi:Ca2+/Na+ antiporter
MLLTLALFALSYQTKGNDGQLSRIKGAVLLLTFCSYTAYLIHHTMSIAS